MCICKREKKKEGRRRKGEEKKRKKKILTIEKSGWFSWSCFCKFALNMNVFQNRKLKDKNKE
jgi:hypothetical protein